MGSKNSSYTPSDEFREQYMKSATVVVSSYVDNDYFEMRNVKSPIRFNSSGTRVFATQDIPKHTAICKINYRNSYRFNDGMVNFAIISSAKIDSDMYFAWCKLRNNYYNSSVAKMTINVSICKDTDGNSVYYTTKDVKEGSELLRCYGLIQCMTVACFNMQIFTNKTITGFTVFVDETLKGLKDDPSYADASDLHRNLEPYRIPKYKIVSHESSLIGTKTKDLCITRTK
jgi:SET domain-containing protein